jgi:hypothetical protein
VSPAQAQTGLDRFCVRVGDTRPRRRVDGTATTVAGLAADEALRPMPATARRGRYRPPDKVLGFLESL